MFSFIERLNGKMHESLRDRQGWKERNRLGWKERNRLGWKEEAGSKTQLSIH